MHGYGDLLVVLGPQQTLGPAFHRGVELARRSGATLHLALFDFHELIDAARTMVGSEVAQLAQTEFLARRRAWLSQQAAALEPLGIRVECEVIWAPVAYEAMICKALDTRADLLLKDLSFEKKPPPRLHFTSLDWRLSRLAPVDVMFVRPDAETLPRRVLAAVQIGTRPQRGPPFNERILNTALKLTRISKSTLDALSVFNYTPLESDEVAYTPAIYDLVNHAHREAFDKLMSGFPLAPERQHRYYGEPADAIRQSIDEQNADLVVIGSSYHSGWNRILFGSTADALLRDIGCDVLIVKPDGFTEELGKHIGLNELRRRYKQLHAQTAVERDSTASAATRNNER